MRRRIHNHVEGAFLAAQYPDGHVYYDGSGERFRTHVKCMSPAWMRVLTSKMNVYLLDSPIYAPNTCTRCAQRNLRVRKSK